MTSIKQLPQSLVDSVSSILEKSVKVTAKVHNSIVSEGLKKFGVSKVESLSEAQKKQYYSWLQLRLQEASCGCGEDVAEDDMPGDAPFHKHGDESGEKKKELGEEDSEDEIVESVALEVDEIAVNGAVGVTDADEQYPVHADVIKDSSPGEGTTEYRLFAQFNTNTLPQIVPPVTLPGAPSVDALRDVVEGLPWFCEVCEKALVAAADLPHQRPEHAGVVSEAYVPTPYDKKVFNIIRQATKSQKVSVEDYSSSGQHIREYQAEIKTGDEFYDTLFVTCREEPSKKAPGKMVWVVRRDNGDYPFDPVVSEPYVPGTELKSLATLKSALAKIKFDSESDDSSL